MVQAVVRIRCNLYPQRWSCTLLSPTQNTEHQQLWAAGAVLAAQCVKGTISLSLSATPLPCSVTLFRSALRSLCSIISLSVLLCFRHTCTQHPEEEKAGGQLTGETSRQTGDSTCMYSLLSALQWCHVNSWPFSEPVRVPHSSAHKTHMHLESSRSILLGRSTFLQCFWLLAVMKMSQK